MFPTFTYSKKGFLTAGVIVSLLIGIVISIFVIKGMNNFYKVLAENRRLESLDTLSMTLENLTAVETICTSSFRDSSGAPATIEFQTGSLAITPIPQLWLENLLYLEDFFAVYTAGKSDFC